MALEKYDEEGSVTFLKIKHGHLCQESKKPRDGYKQIDGVLRDGTPYTKWIYPYKAVSGYVTKIEFYDREFEGRKFRGWHLYIDADGNPCVLDIPFTSRVNSRFMKVAENIDFRKPVRFSAWPDRKTDSTAFNMQQDGVTIPQKYTRENMYDCPEPVQRASGKWDYGEQEDFLVERMMSTVIPTVEAAAALRPLRAEAAGANGANAQSPEDQPVRPKQVEPAFETDDPYPADMEPPLDEPPLDDSDIPF